MIINFKERAMSFDLQILDFIQAHLRNAFLDFIMPIITVFGDGGVFWILLTLVMLAFRKTRRVGAVMAISLLIDVVICNLTLKPLIARVRPYDVNTSVQLIIKPPTDFSFPSGHTGASFAAVSAMYFQKWRYWLPFGILALLIAFSRLYLYVHYPTDVLAGALIGIFAGWLAGLILAYIIKRADEHRSNRQQEE